MTLNDIYLKGKKILKDANVEDYDFDTFCIFKYCFNLERHEFSAYRFETAPYEKEKDFFFFINERKKGKPLQYILGYWYFIGRKFKVKEGVLIPRDDTEVLVDVAANLLKGKKNVKVLDLCSGTGIIAITLASFFKDSKLFAADISDVALEVLKENVTLNNVNNVLVKKVNVLESTLKKDFLNVDLIVSNPPYIPKDDIKFLQRELQFEPTLALDGGPDGLDFYRAICKNFKTYLKSGGNICFEIGINQEDSVKEILEKNHFYDIKMVKDINNIYRVVYATLK